MVCAWYVFVYLQLPQPGLNVCDNMYTLCTRTGGRHVEIYNERRYIVSRWSLFISRAISAVRFISFRRQNGDTNLYKYILYNTKFKYMYLFWIRQDATRRTIYPARDVVEDIGTTYFLVRKTFVYIKHYIIYTWNLRLPWFTHK